MIWPQITRGVKGLTPCGAQLKCANWFFFREKGRKGVFKSIVNVERASCIPAGGPHLGGLSPSGYFSVLRKGRVCFLTDGKQRPGSVSLR